MEALHLIYEHWFITCLIIATFGFWFQGGLIRVVTKKIDRKP